MPPATPGPGSAETLLAAGAVRFEVIPLPGVAEEIRAHLPPTATVTVTSSPVHGWEATVGLAESLARAGRPVVPHLAARQIPDRETLRRILERLTSAKIGEVFVIGGDAPTPAGEFAGSGELLAAIDELAAPVRIGVAAYPEGHPYLDEAEALRALLQAQSVAHRMVTQICFDAEVLEEWLRGVRDHGVRLPVSLGVPGPVTTARLLRISARIGVGPSLRMLSHQGRTVRKLAVPGAFAPDPLLHELDPLLGDPGLGVEGLHVFTFNALPGTGDWWRDRAERAPGDG